MPIFMDNKVYEDSAHLEAAFSPMLKDMGVDVQALPPKMDADPKMVVTPEQADTNKQLDKQDEAVLGGTEVSNRLYVGRTPLQPSTEPAGEFNPADGTGVAGNTQNAPVSPVTPGNIDLNNRPMVKNGNDISTVYSMSIGTDEGEVLIPRVAHDGSGVLSEEDAIKQYRETGKHLGIFKTPDDATAYAEQLHNDQAAQYLPKDRITVTPEQKLEEQYKKALTGVSNPNSVIDTVKQFAVEKFEKIKNALSAPGDAWAGRLDPMSPQGIERASDLAGLMVFGPAPVASKMAEGTLGSFAGVKSKTAPVESLKLAQKIDEVGGSADVIWQKTGWFKGEDGRWKYEIPDQYSELKTHRLEKDKADFDKKDENSYFRVPKEGLPLPEILDHPQLFEAYPDLKNVKVVPVGGYDAMAGIQGWFNHDTKELALGYSTLKDMHSTAMHEIQHWIQSTEGFSRGGNSNMFKSKNWIELEKEYNKFSDRIKDRVKSLYPEDYVGKINDFKRALELEDDLPMMYREAVKGSDYYNTMYARVKTNLIEMEASNLLEPFRRLKVGDAIQRDYSRALFNKYESIKGEVEARNVQDRIAGTDQLPQEVAASIFKENGLELKTLSGWDTAGDKYELLKNGKQIEPEALSPAMKLVWKYLTQGKPKSERAPFATQSHAPNEQIWSPLDSAGLKDLYNPAAVTQAAEVKPGQLPKGYYDKVPQGMRLSRSGTEPSHPGYRWEVYDPQSGKTMRKDIMTRSGASRTQDSLDNKYGGYKYRVRMVEAKELTESEAKFLKDNDIAIDPNLPHK